MKYPPHLLHQLQLVDKTTDKLGKSIDTPIRLLVAALWTAGINTDNSCGGHEEYRNGAPYVTVESKQASVLEPKIFGKSAIEDSLKNAQLLQRLTLLNLEESESLLKFLDGFYANRMSDIWIRLIVHRLGNGRSQLECQGARFIDAFADDDERKKWLVRARKEMDDFTAYIIENIE